MNIDFFYCNIVKASEDGNLDFIKQIISDKGHIYIYQSNNYRNNLDIVKYLISVGANEHIYNEFSIECAAMFGHWEVVKYLILSGANINKTNGLTNNHIYDLIKMGVKNFGKYHNVYEECMIYHNQIIQKCLNKLPNVLIKIIVKY